MFLKISKIYSEASDLKYATIGSAGLDISYPYPETIFIQPGEYQLIPSGISIEIPKNYEIQIRSRSGCAFKYGIIVLNAPATIDSDYRGEIKILLYNVSKKTFELTQHMRVAQLVAAYAPQFEIIYTKKLSATDRGEGGFGSSGLFYNENTNISLINKNENNINVKNTNINAKHNTNTINTNIENTNITDKNNINAENTNINAENNITAKNINMSSINNNVEKTNDTNMSSKNEVYI